MLKGSVNLLLFLFEVMFWLAYFIRHFVSFVMDAHTGLKNAKGGVLLCPHGHEISLEGGVYKCEACGFVYEGNIHVCPNPECGATTPYVECPVCHLSVRNPLRWGRP